MDVKPLLFAALALAACAANAQSSLGRISSELGSARPQEESISIVRETALREAASTVGALAGLHDRSCELDFVLKTRTVDLDKRFRFSSMMMGRGMLPPVISEARDSVSFETSVMRVATRVYKLDEPAVLVDVPPTWRNWLYVGLSLTGCDKPFVIPEVAIQLRPQNDKEAVYFSRVLKESYDAGRTQAQQVFDQNLARLERTYQGMRRYFELYERGMVSAPVLVSDTEVVSMDDPNTLLVGNTVIRITNNASFIQRSDQWKPLATK